MSLFHRRINLLTYRGSYGCEQVRSRVNIWIEHNELTMSVELTADEAADFAEAIIKNARSPDDDRPMRVSGAAR